MLRNPFVQIALWTLAIGAVLSVIVLNVPWLPEAASTQADPIDKLYLILSVLSAFIFGLVVAVIIVAIVHFRRRHGDLSDGAPIHGNSTVEAVWTAIPAIMMLAAAVAGALVLRDIEEPKAATQTIRVTGEQFDWSFEYPENFRSAQLHLVKDKNYYFKINTKDVLHSFWVPEFRMKKDAVPGITTTIRVTPTRIGSYAVVCAELCGLGHSTMRAIVRVTDQAHYNAWASATRKNQATVGSTADKLR